MDMKIVVDEMPKNEFGCLFYMSNNPGIGTRFKYGHCGLTRFHPTCELMDTSDCTYLIEARKIQTVL